MIQVFIISTRLGSTVVATVAPYLSSGDALCCVKSCLGWTHSIFVSCRSSPLR